MDYSNWLMQPPYHWTQDEKEAHYVPLLFELTSHHCHCCQPYGQAIQTLYEKNRRYDSSNQIPMLPISLFKTEELKSIPDSEIFKVITSSGTSGVASHLYLDAFNAQNQQLALYNIVKAFIGSSRLPMLIVDTPDILKNRDAFNARGAAVLGFSIFAKRKYYALKPDLSVDLESIRTFIQTYRNQPVLIFGFTFMIWQYLCEALANYPGLIDLSNAILIHGGGWKKMQDRAVSPHEYKKRLYEQFQIHKVHNYYGMAEQTGCIYMECEQGHLHASIFSAIIIRNPENFSVCPVGETGIVQVLTPLATSYPGHSILTEDMGTLLGIDDCPCGRLGKYFRIDGRMAKAEIRGCSDAHN